VLAVWLLVHPAHLKEFQGWLKANGMHAVLVSASVTTRHKVLLTADDMRAAAKALPGKVVLLEQRSGDQVYVPPGWLHFVVNVEPCCKLAYDSVRPCQLPDYVVAHHTVNARVGYSAEDYVEVPKLVTALCAEALTRFLNSGGRPAMLM
jgi:hypothetical protein